MDDKNPHKLISFMRLLDSDKKLAVLILSIPVKSTPPSPFQSYKFLIIKAFKGNCNFEFFKVNLTAWSLWFQFGISWIVYHFKIKYGFLNMLDKAKFNNLGTTDSF